MFYRLLNSSTGKLKMFHLLSTKHFIKQITYVSQACRSHTLQHCFAAYSDFSGLFSMHLIRSHQLNLPWRAVKKWTNLTLWHRHTMRKISSNASESTFRGSCHVPTRRICNTLGKWAFIRHSIESHWVEPKCDIGIKAKHWIHTTPKRMINDTRRVTLSSMQVRFECCDESYIIL